MIALFYFLSVTVVALTTVRIVDTVLFVWTKGNYWCIDKSYLTLPLTCTQ